MSLILGLNLNHDASVAVTTSDGKILFSVAEERLCRQKGAFGFPRLALELAKTEVDFSAISQIVVGSHSRFDLLDMPSVIEIFEPELAARPGFTAGGATKGHYGRFPGFEALAARLSVDIDCVSPKEYVMKKFSELLEVDAPITFINHHDAHAASAFFGSSFDEALVVTLDGSGDGECGTIKVFSEGKFQSDLLRIQSFNSLGLIYSSVTKRYNFLPGRHEGKITGLAAFGQETKALDYFKSVVKFKDGQIELRIPQSRFERVRARLRNKFVPGKYPIMFSLQEVVDFAAHLTSDYPDLAFAIQKVLEERIVQTVEYWLRESGQSNLALAGGVFANVRINQMLAELPGVNNIFVYPDMGDSGLAVGGIWHYLSGKQLISGSQILNSMTLGPESRKLTNLPDNIIREDFNWQINTTQLARDLEKGKTVAVVIGRMEIGPRALCNRTILASCANHEINDTLNKKLNRTEFMPFAPVALDSSFREIFDVSKHGSLIPFYFMTMACDVNVSWLHRIPAAVHVDGTARPQLLSRSQNPFVYGLIEEYAKLTQVPVLINTSFNAHEEPIIMDLDQGLQVLSKGSVDFLVTEDSLYKRVLKP
jgi:carbamoyltransferase